MKLNGIRPAPKLLFSLGGGALLCLIYDVIWTTPDKPLSSIALLVTAALSLLALMVTDVLLSKRPPLVKLSRNILSNLSVNSPTTVTLSLDNQGKVPLQLTLADMQPESWEHSTNTESLYLPPNTTLDVRYNTTPRRRGEFTLKTCECRLMSTLGLWQIDWLISVESTVKVYPDFRMLRDLSGLQGSATLSQEGLRQYQQRGAGMDFKELRDYRAGEPLRQIDWHASSRFNKLISREFQDEKNQPIVLMLDAGQRMMTQDSELRYFDHALNTLIALSHTVLKNGDELSLMSFGQQLRWLNKVKGIANMSRVLNHFFDLQPQNIASDYLQAAQQLMLKCPKRSLVILVTCLRDENFDELLQAVQLMQKRHLVVVASIREKVFEDIAREPVKSHQQATTWLASEDVTARIVNNQKALQAHGVLCISADSHSITPSTINTYLKVKRAGAL